MTRRRRPCSHCGGPKEPGQQFFCISCDTDEVRALRIKQTKKRNKMKARALREADREGRPLADRKRVWRKDLPEGLGWCSRCKQLKPIEEFTANYKHGSGGGSYCRKCRSAQHHEVRLRRHYRMTAAEYAEILSRQEGRCAICRKKPGNRRLSVDHDHRCCAGKVSCGSCVRGLLCSSCNFEVLGRFGDSVEILERAISYLQDPPARRDTQ